jgi:hypothetical protein
MKKLLLLVVMMAAFAMGNFYGGSTTPSAEAQRWDHWEYWDDVRMPATVALVGQGAGNAADQDTLGYLLFDTAQDEEAFFTMQMPHGYKYGSDMEAHVHWAKSTSAGGDVVFKIDYECADIGETFTNSLGTTLTLTYEIDDSDTAFKHAYADTTLFNPGFSGVSGMCLMRLWRDVSEDDYAADAIVYELDVHFISDTVGSTNELSK